MNQAVRRTRIDGEQTRARLLQVAGRLFGERGFAATPSKLVAEQAGADLASINYHFGNRQGLYQAVLAEAHRQLLDMEELRQIVELPEPPATRLHRLIVALVSAPRNPDAGWCLPVLAAEFLSPSSQLGLLFQEEVQPKAQLLMRLLAEVSGLSIDDPALLRCAMSVVGPLVLLMLARNGLPGPAAQVNRMPADEIVEHLFRFSLGGLQAIAQQRLCADRHTGQGGCDDERCERS